MPAYPCFQISNPLILFLKNKNSLFLIRGSSPSDSFGVSSSKWQLTATCASNTLFKTDAPKAVFVSSSVILNSDILNLPPKSNSNYLISSKVGNVYITIKDHLSSIDG